LAGCVLCCFWSIFLFSFCWNILGWLRFVLFLAVTGSRCRLFLPMRYFKCEFSAFDTHTHTYKCINTHTFVYRVRRCGLPFQALPFLAERKRVSMWARESARKERRNMMMYAYRNPTYTGILSLFPLSRSPKKKHHPNFYSSFSIERFLTVSHCG